MSNIFDDFHAVAAAYYGIDHAEPNTIDKALRKTFGTRSKASRKSPQGNELRVMAVCLEMENADEGVKLLADRLEGLAGDFDKLHEELEKANSRPSLGEGEQAQLKVVLDAANLDPCKNPIMGVKRLLDHLTTNLPNELGFIYNETNKLAKGGEAFSEAQKLADGAQKEVLMAEIVALRAELEKSKDENRRLGAKEDPQRVCDVCDESCEVTDAPFGLVSIAWSKLKEQGKPRIAMTARLFGIPEQFHDALTETVRAGALAVGNNVAAQLGELLSKWEKDGDGESAPSTDTKVDTPQVEDGGGENTKAEEPVPKPGVISIVLRDGYWYIVTPRGVDYANNPSKDEMIDLAREVARDFGLEVHIYSPAGVLERRIVQANGGVVEEGGE